MSLSGNVNANGTLVHRIEVAPAVETILYAALLILAAGQVLNFLKGRL